MVRLVSSQGRSKRVVVLAFVSLCRRSRLEIHSPSTLASLSRYPCDLVNPAHAPPLNTAYLLKLFSLAQQPFVLFR